MRFVNIIGRHVLQQTEVVRHPPVAGVGQLVIEVAAAGDLQPGQRRLPASCDVGHARRVDGRRSSLEIVMKLIGPVEVALRHPPCVLAPRFAAIQLLERGGQLRRGREHHVTADERVGDVEELAQVVSHVKRGEQADHLVLPGHHLRDAERAVVRCAEHDEAPAAHKPRVLHGLPKIGVQPDEIAADQPAHRMSDEMYGLALKVPADQLGEIARRVVDVFAPVIGERRDVPAASEGEHGAGVVAFVHPRRYDAPSRVRFLGAVRGELEAVDTSIDQAEEVHPDVVRLPRTCRNTQVRAGNAVEKDHVAERG